jgi:hypothetical protein
MTAKSRPRRIRELVRQFKENGMKMMLEDPANVRDVLGLLDVAWRDDIDFSHLDQVKTTFIRRDYRQLASELVFTAPLIGRGRSRRNLLIYLLIEHQSEPDQLMPLRLADSQVQIFRYQVRKWLQTHLSTARICLRPILPVVFYTGLRRWPKVGTLTELIEGGDEFREVTPIVERPLFINLPELDGAKLERDGGFFGWILRLFQERMARSKEFDELLERVVARLDGMPAAERRRLGELLSYVRAMLYHERSESEQGRLQQIMENSVQDEATRQEVEKMRKTGAEALMERGAQKAGLLTRQQTLVRLLRRRFGDISLEVLRVVEGTDDAEQLDDWLDRFATAQTLEELGIREQN